MADVIVSTDGYVGADGEAGWAFVARWPGHEEVHRGALETCPPHLAEWEAAARALRWADARLAEGDSLELRTDSALVAKGLAHRRPEMSGEAAELRAESRRALARLAQRGVRAPRRQRGGRPGCARGGAGIARADGSGPGAIRTRDLWLRRPTPYPG